jgi:hypothetical protein
MIGNPRIPNTILLCAAFAAALLFAPGQALAINVCGDGICQGTGIPPETPQNCQADCGFCGDGICGFPESCSACINDCKGNCLGFTLANELKKSGCAGDDDGDCLDNLRESDLAWIVAPYYYYDEDEDCSGAWYTDGPNALHYGRRDFVQVRPTGSAVSQWAPGSQSVKTVQITYFLLHPHDCQSHLGFGGHQGDSEHVRFRLRSHDLRTWYLVSGDYHHHNRVHTFSGEYLRARALEIGTVFPNVAADEDGHGSWPGEKGSKSACAGSEDDFCTFGTCDCFRGTMQGAFTSGYREILSASRNIGGPAPELWRPSVVSVSGSDAWSVFDVGHGAIAEYWTPRSDAWKKFCGWECSARFVDSGECFFVVHGETGCSSPLSQKVDTTSFTKALATAAPAVAERRNQPRPVDQEALAARLRAGLVVAVGAALPPEEAEDFRRRLEEAADPVVALVPMLEARTREEQAETLAWVLATGREKLAAALAPGLLTPGRLTPAESETAAAELLAAVAALLEAEGYVAPDLERRAASEPDPRRP